MQWRVTPWDPYPEPSAPRGAWLASAIAEAGAARAAVAPGRERLAWPVTFNIDDASTRDIDDVVSVRRAPGGSGGWDFAVTIADVASCIPAGSPLDDAAYRAAQTVYLEGAAVRPMLPRALSEELCSLQPGQARLGVSMFFSWREGAPDVSPPELRPVLVTSARAFSYERVVADAAAVGWANELRAVKDVARVLGRGRLGIRDRDLGEDPHTWIEALMLFYNVTVGLALRACGMGLLRRHASPDATRLDRMSGLLGGELRFLAFSAASYCPATDAETVHWGLSAACYTHASSPLRRYADLHNQRVLLGLPVRAEPSDAALLAAHLDARAVATKRFERDAFFLSAVAPNALTRVAAVFLHVLEEDEGEGTTDEWAGAEAGGGGGVGVGEEPEGAAATSLRGRASRAEFWVVAWKRLVRMRVTVTERSSDGAATFLSKDETLRFTLFPGCKCAITAYCDTRSAVGELRKRVKMTVGPTVG